jgi:hypothetical protein
MLLLLLLFDCIRPKGIQNEGVMANAKHWINNEIENDRRKVSAHVDERTRFEIYYPPFEAAVRAGSGHYYDYYYYYYYHASIFTTILRHTLSLVSLFVYLSVCLSVCQ